MRRTFAVVLGTAVLLTWWTSNNLFLKAQGEDEGAVPPTCVDINGDQTTDLSDAVYLLSYLFRGGPEPLACADHPPGLEARVSALEEWQASQDFARLIAGTYLANLEAEGNLVKGFLTFTADGGFILSTQFQYGHIVPAGFQSVWHGTWRKTGEDQITADAYWFAFGEDGSPPSVTGSEVARVRWVFALGANEVTGQTVEQGAWSPGLDPLVDLPDGCPPVLTMAARRLGLEPPPAHCQ